MSKNVKLTTTRPSTTLIQSKVTFSEQNKIIFTRILLQYKWLKPQLQALHLHQFTQTARQYKVKNIKDVYIQSLQSVKQVPQLLKKCYKMQEILKEIKRSIAKRAKGDQLKPNIKSNLFRIIREKYNKMVREREINFLKQKINPKLLLSGKKQSEPLQFNKKKAVIQKLEVKSPNATKTKRSQEENSKNKLNNTKLNSFKDEENLKVEDYGLKYYHIKNKPSLNSLNAQYERQSPQKVIQKSNHKPNHYYFNFSRPKHKKTNSNTPQKSIKTSRKTSSKQALCLRAEKVKTSVSKQKDKALRFNKKHS